VAFKPTARQFVLAVQKTPFSRTEPASKLVGRALAGAFVPAVPIRLAKVRAAVSSMKPWRRCLIFVVIKPDLSWALSRMRLTNELSI
jgi:hypothetical protein